MSLFGKILLFFNLVLAGGFVYLATQDWQGRQTIQGGGLRHQLVIVGLPLDGPADFKADGETEFRHEGAGGVPTETVSKKLLETYFQGVGGAGTDPNTLTTNAAVPNQVAEVNRVKRKIEEILGRTEGAQEQLNLLRGWLIYQVETFPERLRVLELAATDRPDAESGKPRPKTNDEMAQDAQELQRRLMARLDGVANPNKSLDPAVTSKITDEELAAAANDEERAKLLQVRAAKIDESRVNPLDEDERRRKIAHLLVHLNPESGWQKRVLAVVGARNYIKAVLTQSRRFEEMSLQLEQLLLADQEAFFAELQGRPAGSDSSEHRGLIREAQEKTLIANRMAALKAKWVEQATKDADLVRQRETQLRELRDQLAKIKGQVDVMLSRQSAIESGLFEVQREVAITLDEVYQFEAELAARERKLAAGGK